MARYAANGAVALRDRSNILPATKSPQIGGNLPLSEMKAGDDVVVQTVIGSLHQRLQLMERGILPGAHIHIIRTGNPMVVESNYQRMTLSKDLSQRIITTR